MQKMPYMLHCGREGRVQNHEPVVMQSFCYYTMLCTETVDFTNAAGQGPTRQRKRNWAEGCLTAEPVMNNH